MLTYLISLLVHGLGMYQSVKLQSFSEPNWDTITALVIPAAYHSTKVTSGDSGGALAPIFNRFSDPDITGGLLVISRGTAILLLGVYVTYLFFQVIKKTSYSFFWFTFFTKLKTHPDFFESKGQEEEEEPTMSVIAAASGYVVKRECCVSNLTFRLSDFWV